MTLVCLASPSILIGFDGLVTFEVPVLGQCHQEPLLHEDFPVAHQPLRLAAAAPSMEDLSMLLGVHGAARESCVETGALRA